MVEFVNNCKNYNPTIPKHRPRRKRTVKKSDHKHEYELYRAYERSRWGNGKMIYQTIVGHCIWCGKLIQGHDLLVECGYETNRYSWMHSIDFSKYDFPIIYVKWDSHMNLQLITDLLEVHEMKLEIQAENKKKLERGC